MSLKQDLLSTVNLRPLHPHFHTFPSLSRVCIKRPHGIPARRRDPFLSLCGSIPPPPSPGLQTTRNDRERHLRPLGTTKQVTPGSLGQCLHRGSPGSRAPAFCFRPDGDDLARIRWSANTVFVSGSREPPFVRAMCKQFVSISGLLGTATLSVSGPPRDRRAAQRHLPERGRGGAMSLTNFK